MFDLTLSFDNTEPQISIKNRCFFENTLVFNAPRTFTVKVFKDKRGEPHDLTDLQAITLIAVSSYSETIEYHRWTQFFNGLSGTPTSGTVTTTMFTIDNATEGEFSLSFTAAETTHFLSNERYIDFEFRFLFPASDLRDWAHIYVKPS